MVGELQVQLSAGGAVAKDRFGGIAGAIGGTSTPKNIDLIPLSEMFGAPNTCACSQCQSVHSAAAYLYNLLHWMRSDVVGAYDRLIEKRPDITHIKLSCENTHTVLPYIDLVNEALSWTLEDSEVPPTETKWGERELRLQPEYRFAKAETKLKKLAFPAALPFYRSASEGRAAISGAGLHPAKIMQTFLPADRSTWSPIQVKAHRAAWLGIDITSNGDEVDLYDLITTSVAPNDFWTKYTGVTSSPQKNIGKIMQALGLDFAGVDALVKLNFVSKTSSGQDAFVVEGIDYHDTECRYEKANYVLSTNSSTGFGKAIAWRAWRLLRLAKVLEITPAELDLLISRFNLSNGGNAVEINEDFIAFLSGAAEIEVQTEVSRNLTLSYLELLSLIHI